MDDQDDCIKELRSLAEQGDAGAQLILDEFEKRGTVDPNYQKTETLFRNAAEEGDAEAQYKLGEVYWLAGDGRDIHEALQWFRKSAEQGNASAQRYLGLAYQDGVVVAQDLDEAAKWYRRSAEQGEISSMLSLFFMHREAKDYVQAHVWLNLAVIYGSWLLESARDEFEKDFMSSAEISKAKEMAREWKRERWH